MSPSAAQPSRQRWGSTNVASQVLLLLQAASHWLTVTGDSVSEAACPDGYTSVAGNIPGGDKFGRGFNNRVRSITVCEQDCSDRPDCRSFHFSPLARQCFLNEYKTPVHHEVYKDYLLCTKDGVEDPPPVEEEEEEEEEVDPDREARENFGNFTLDEYRTAWEAVQKHADQRLSLVKERYLIMRAHDLTEEEKVEQIDDLEEKIKEWDQQYETILLHYKLMSPAPPPPKAKPRKKIHNPDYVSDEDDEDFLMTGRHWGGRYGRKKRSRRSRFRDTDPSPPKKTQGKKSNPALIKELDEIVADVDDLREKIDTLGFTVRERQKLHDDLDRHMDDELDRFEEIIEAEEDDDVPWEYEDYKGRIVKISKEERKREQEDAKRRKKRAKDKGKGLKAKRREVRRKVVARERMDSNKEADQKVKEAQQQKEAERRAAERKAAGLDEVPEPAPEVTQEAPSEAEEEEAGADDNSDAAEEDDEDDVPEL